MNLFYPRTSPASTSTILFIYTQCKFSKYNSHLSSPDSLYKRAPPILGWWTCCLLYLACCFWVRLHAPGPGPFLTSIWLSKPFLSEKLLAVKFFCLTLLMAAIVHACLSPFTKEPTLPPPSLAPSPE